jgi:transcriptional regulator with PAS, ATPase and Fis domain
MRDVYDQIRIAAATDAAVLITGESGTGKELAARSIHDLSPRAKQPFVPVNTAAIPSDLLESEVFGHEKGAFTGAIDTRIGCFEQAHGGTLFLDEIGEMPIELQPKLLRVLEDGRLRRVGGKTELQVDVRIICATNLDPMEAIDRGRLREDLFYRINVFQIQLPPLRERDSDLTLLIEYFLEQFNHKHGMHVEAIRPETREQCQRYSWPGNVRELRNVLERAVVVAREGWIEPHHLPPYVRSPRATEEKAILPHGITAAETEKALILQTLERVNNNKAEAARQLGLDVKTIRNKLKSYGLS